MDNAKPPWQSWTIWLFLIVAIVPQIQSEWTTLALPEPYGRVGLFVLGVIGIVARVMSSGTPIVIKPTNKE